MEPFKFGCIVGDEHFCPRPALEAELRRYISGGQNLVLQGERRRGKSSLVVRVVKGIRGMGLLYVDLLGICSAADFCRRVMDGIVGLDASRSFLKKTVSMIAFLRPLVVIDQDTGLPAISLDCRSAANPSSVTAIMSMIASHAKKRRICVVFDEFQDVLDLPDADRVLAEMRSKIQFMSDTAFVFLGSVRNQMSEIFAHPRSPFFKSALEVGIGEMTDASFAQFLIRRFEKGRRKADVDFVGDLIVALDGVPGDVQELCDALWSVTQTGDRVDASKLTAAYRYIFAHEGASYETYLKLLTPQQRKVLRALAAAGGKHVVSSGFLDEAGIYNASSVKKALSRLIEIGHVYYFADEYKFVSPFFREWIRRRFGAIGE